MEKPLRPGDVLGRRVREARTALGWTQQQLADRLTEIGRTTDRATITRTEKGQTLAALDMVIALGAALHVPPVHLLVPLSNDESVAITPGIVVDAPTARAWIRGVGLLPGEDTFDIWPHLPESEKRAALGGPSIPGVASRSIEPAEILKLALAGWFDAAAVTARVAAANELANRKRKEKDDG